MAHPDFSGEWTFSAGESTLQISTPDVALFTIQHREPVFRLERTLSFGGRGDTFAIELTVGAVPLRWERGGAVLYSTARWEGAELCFDTRIVQGEEQSNNSVRYRLQEDGAVLVADESFRGPRQNYDNRWVFRKSPGQ